MRDADASHITTEQFNMKAPMTFDQLQRYRLAGEILDALRPRRPLRILDAGRRAGFLKNFLPGGRIVNLDRRSTEIRALSAATAELERIRSSAAYKLHQGRSGA